MAPERIKRKEYSFPIDIWGLGILVYELATGDYPYKLRIGEKLENVIIGLPEPQLPQYFSKYLQDFLFKCLQKNPYYRLTASELCVI